DLPVASQKKIVRWWADTVPRTQLYIGNALYKIKNNSDPAWDKKREIPKQLALARATEEVDGNIFFSARSLMGKHDKINKRLKEKIYPYPAHGPGPLNALQQSVPGPTISSLRQQGNQLELCIRHNDSVPRFLNLYGR